MGNTERETAHQVAPLRVTHRNLPSPFDVREDGRRTEPHHSLMHTQSVIQNSNAIQAIDSNDRCSTYLSSSVIHTHTSNYSFYIILMHAWR